MYPITSDIINYATQNEISYSEIYRDQRIQEKINNRLDAMYRTITGSSIDIKTKLNQKYGLIRDELFNHYKKIEKFYDKRKGAYRAFFDSNRSEELISRYIETISKYLNQTIVEINLEIEDIVFIESFCNDIITDINAIRGFQTEEDLRKELINEINQSDFDPLDYRCHNCRLKLLNWNLVGTGYHYRIYTQRKYQCHFCTLDYMIDFTEEKEYLLENTVLKIELFASNINDVKVLRYYNFGLLSQLMNAE